MILLYLRTQVFVVGAAPFASEVLGKLEDADSIQALNATHITESNGTDTNRTDRNGNSTAGTALHMERMRGVSRGLLQDECFTAASSSDRSTVHCWTSRAQQQRRKPFLLLASGILLDPMLGRELQHVITTTRARVILASMDAGFASLASNMRARARPLLLSAVTIPYWAHSFAVVVESAPSPSEPSPLAPSPSAEPPPSAAAAPFVPRSGVLFHGGTRRFDFEVRTRTEAVLRALIRRVHMNTTHAGHATPPVHLTVDLRVSEMTRGRGNDQLTGHWE